MKSKAIEQVISYITILLIGAILIYFSDGLAATLLYFVTFILFGLAFVLLKKLFLKKKTESEEYPLPVMDERIEYLSLKFIAQIFGFSHFVGAAILFVLFIIDKNSMIRVEYVLYYVMGVLFFTMMFGLKIVKKFDQ